MDKKNLSFIKKIIEDKSRAQLNELIMDICGRFPDSYEFILRWQQSFGKIDVQAELALEYWKKAENIIDQFNDYGGGPDYDEEEAYDYINKIQELIPTLQWAVRCEIMDGMLVQYRRGNSGFDDVLSETCFDMCSSKDELLYLADKFLSFGGSWDKRKVMSIYRQIGADEDYLKLRESSLEYGMDYLELAHYYEEKDNIEKAIIWAHKGLTKGIGAMNGLVLYLFDYYEQRKDTEQLKSLKQVCEQKNMELNVIYDRLFVYYKTTGDYENAKMNLLHKFDIVRGRDLNKLYLEVKKYLTEKDWMQVEEKLFKSLKERDVISYLHICLEKGMKKEVLDTIISKPIPRYSSWGWADDLNTFADNLKKDYPNEIIKYYWDRAISFLSREKNRSNYKQSMPYFKKAKQIYLSVLKDKNAWQKRLVELRGTYSNRPAFLEESRVLD